MKNSESKLLLGLGIGVALGAAIGYIMGNDKREEWLDQANVLADKVRANVKSAIYKGKSEVNYLKEDIDDSVLDSLIKGNGLDEIDILKELHYYNLNRRLFYLQLSGADKDYQEKLVAVKTAFT